MSDHLPECPRRVIPDRYAEKARAIGIYAGDCICSALRACEQRVWDEAYACGFNAGRDHGEKIGRAAGLEAARGAIVTAERRLHFDGEANRWIVEIHALAAIDALRDTPTRSNMEDPL